MIYIIFYEKVIRMPKVKFIRIIICLPLFFIVYPKTKFTTTLHIVFIHSCIHLLNYLAKKYMFIQHLPYLIL